MDNSLHIEYSSVYTNCSHIDTHTMHMNHHLMCFCYWGTEEWSKVFKTGDVIISSKFSIFNGKGYELKVWCVIVLHINEGIIVDFFGTMV